MLIERKRATIRAGRARSATDTMVRAAMSACTCQHERSQMTQHTARIPWRVDVAATAPGVRAGGLVWTDTPVEITLPAPRCA
jgi:hypothetical protein